MIGKGTKIDYNNAKDKEPSRSVNQSVKNGTSQCDD